MSPLLKPTFGNITALRGEAFAHVVLDLHAGIGAFLHRVVVRRTDGAVSSWRNCLLEDPLFRPFWVVEVRHFSPSLFLKCDPALTRDGSGILSYPVLRDEEFRKAWFPFFSRSVRGHACFSDFEGEVECWLPILEEVDLDAVEEKSMTVGGLDGSVGGSQGSSCILV